MTSHVSSTATVSEKAWAHPKITPFRLAFILTTGGLGIAKAALVSNGKTASSTTVEWITGVVVALIFQFLGSYDSEHSSARPRYLDRLFCYDCLGRSGTAISEPHEDFSPNRLSLDGSELPQIVTGYRLLVSIVFAAFGLAKMLCGYLGSSSAMYMLDWVIAVPLTLGLYCMGLYEESRSRSLRKFFEVDYSSQTLHGFKMASIYFGSLVLCSCWFEFWLETQRVVSAGLDPAQFHDNTRESVVKDVILNHLLKWIVTFFCIAMLEAGALGLGCVLWPIIKSCSGRYATSILNGGIPVAFVTLYAFFFLTGIYVVVFLLFYFFFTAQMFAPLVNNPNNSLLERIVLSVPVIPIAAILGIPTVFVLFKLSKMLMSIGRSLLSYH